MTASIFTIFCTLGGFGSFGEVLQCCDNCFNVGSCSAKGVADVASIDLSTHYYNHTQARKKDAVMNRTFVFDKFLEEHGPRLLCDVWHVDHNMSRKKQDTGTCARVSLKVQKIFSRFSYLLQLVIDICRPVIVS